MVIDIGEDGEGEGFVKGLADNGTGEGAEEEHVGEAILERNSLLQAKLGQGLAGKVLGNVADVLVVVELELAAWAG